MRSPLAKLPSELLTHIVAYIETAQTLLRLSLTCKRLHEYIETDGFRAFVQARFPSIQTPPFWRDAAHALTTLSRAWDRRAIIARSFEPSMTTTRHPGGQTRSSRLGGQQLRAGRRRQTMGYQPVIDSYEEQMGSDWSSRREVLIWGAGAELIMRVKGMGEKNEEQYQALQNYSERARLYDPQHHHNINWIFYKPDRLEDGRDDITSVKLLRHFQSPENGTEYVLIGRASGNLECVGFVDGEASGETVSHYQTNGRAVRSASVNNAKEPILATCLSDTDLAIYPVFNQTMDNVPRQDISIIPAGKSGRTWSTRFLSHNRLAVGLGPFTTPLHVYDVSHDGIAKEPLRRFGTAGADLKISSDDRNEMAGSAASGISSVYAIAPIRPSSQAGGAEGEIFLSGWYDGAVRLHDLRSPSSCTASYTDNIDTFTAIYSLLPFGRERFVAGGARHSIIKVFDLRMPGGKVYYAADLDPCATQSSRNPPSSVPSDSVACCTHHYEAKHDRRDWNVFLNPRGMPRNRLGSSLSPVYSLSAPSPYSPHFYAGVEANVIQFDIVSMMDKYPDPIFKYGPKKTGNRDTDICNKWGLPLSDVMQLACYEQTGIGALQLRVQAKVGDMEESVPGWDERWTDGKG